MFAGSTTCTARCQRMFSALCAAASLVAAVPVFGAVTEWESSLRRNIAWQVALDNLGFSPGLIDGQIGFKTQIATKEFQRVRGLPITGQLDDATAKALEIDPDNVLGKYTVDAADLAEVGPCPQSWIAKSKLTRLGHESLDDVLAEKFHCKKALLDTLNPGKSINSLKPGTQVIVPILNGRQDWSAAAYLEVNLGEKIVRVIGKDKKLIALFHCSIAKDKAKLPDHDAEVVKTAADPTYHFDPKMWPEVKERITTPLDIPPGPRNPVGRFWIGLSLPGYGMHGTPNPELIGKTGSHGCFRLTNWDAIRLGKMVREGMPVKFVTTPSSVALK